MATLATGLIGAAVGGVMGATGIGFSLGAALGQSFLGGSGQHRYTHQEGSRLSDLKVQTSQVGMMIPLVYGTYRIAGNMIWSTDIREHSHTTTQTQPLEGGGKGGHHHSHSVTQTTTTYTYSVSFALGLCQGVILGLRRIWADGKLIYNTSRTATTQTLISSQLRAKQLRLYCGTEEQLPDPLIEAYVGAGQVPAFRGLAYVVFEDLPLAEFGNRVPNITVEVVQVGEHTQNLSPVAIEVEKPLTDAVGQFSAFDGGIIHTQLGGDGWHRPPERVDLDLNLQVIQRFRGAYTQGPCYQPMVKNMPNLFLKTGFLAAWYDVVTGQHAPIEPGLGEPLMGIYRSGHLYCIYGMPGQSAPCHLVHYQVNSPDELPKTVLSKLMGLQQRFGLPAATLLAIDRQQGDVFALLQVAQTLKLLAFDPVSAQPVKTWELKLDDALASLPHSPLRAPYALSLNHDSTCALVTYRSPSQSHGYFVALDVQSEILYADPHKIDDFVGQGAFHFLTDDLLHVGGLSAATNPKTPAIVDDMITQLSHMTGLSAESLKRTSLYPHSSQGSETVTTTKARICGSHALEPAPLLLAEVIKALCQRVDISVDSRDLSQLYAYPQVVHGFVLSQSTALREALLPLQQAYQFDIIESGFTLRFIPRGLAEPITLSLDEVGAEEYGQSRASAWIETHRPTTELPQRLDILFTQREQDYQPGHQLAQRQIAAHHHSQTIELPLALTDAAAANIAEILLYTAWTGRTQYELTLSRRYAFLDPGDVIDVNGQTLRLTSVAYGDPGLVKVKAIQEDASIYAVTDVAQASQPFLEPLVSAAEIPLPSPTQLYLLDIPLLRDEDDDTGFYGVVSHLLPHWPGAVVAESKDNGQTFKALYSQNQAATVGIAQQALADGKTTVFDEENALIVTLTHGELSSTTEFNVLNGENLCRVGQEILQFQQAILQPDGSYQLSRWLRGRHGTEGAVNSHQANEPFILLDHHTLHRIKSPAAQIGLSRIYKAITLGRSVAASTPYAFINTARGKKPLSPVHLQGVRNKAGDLTLTWISRTRLQGAWRDGVDAPQDPEITGYEIQIVKEQDITRILTSQTEVAIYTAEQQIVDFGSTQTAITIYLYAMGKTVGRGFPAMATL